VLKGMVEAGEGEDSPVEGDLVSALKALSPLYPIVFCCYLTGRSPLCCRH
jgi:hypothetical protein